MTAFLSLLPFALATELPADYSPPQSLAPLVKTLQPAVVAISVKQTVEVDKSQFPTWAHPFLDQMPDSQVMRGEGSGFVISADGYILTNNHVVDGATEVKVELDDKEIYTARVVGADSRIDVALVKIDVKTPLPYVELGESGKAEVGDWVVAIGNPLGLSHTVSAGIISAKGRVIGAGPYDDFLQTDASINPGNSGGPLFDTHGRVIGINTAISANGQGIGFAVPIDMVKPVLDDLRERGKVARGWIGVSLADLPTGSAAELGAKDGAVAVAQVYPGTPGAKAGLKAGDLVTTLDGVPTATAEDFIRRIGGHKPGDSVKLTVLRDGKAQALAVTLAERPDEKDLAKSTKADAPAAPAGPDELASIGVKLDGLTVAGVEEGGPAQGRLVVGDVVVEVNHTKVASAADVEKALGKSKTAATFLVRRGDAQVFVPLALDGEKKD